MRRITSPLRLLLAVLVLAAGGATAVVLPAGAQTQPQATTTDVAPGTRQPTPSEQADPTGARHANPTGAACFGGAARDPENPCGNPALALSVVPDPRDPEAAQRYESCTQVEDTSILRACFWGPPPNTATRTVALIGDSHASHWRAALSTLVVAHHWRAVSIQRAGCPLSLAQADFPDAERRAGCTQWNLAVQGFLLEHPEIDTVFTSNHRGTVIPPPGDHAQTDQENGYAFTFLRMLAGHVRHVVIIRDTPRLKGATIPCVITAEEAGRPPGRACALTRRYALPADPAVVAADRLHSPAVQVADLSGFFCGVYTCPPVIGGVLVLRDVSHMTTTFSTTLGPYLERAVDALSAQWGSSGPSVRVERGRAWLSSRQPSHGLLRAGSYERVRR